MTTDTDLDPNPSAPPARDLAAEIALLSPWGQNLLLPDGTQTAPDQSLAEQPITLWEKFRDYLPADLSAYTALDIGCNAGFFAIELARRGAQVSALEAVPHHLRQAHWTISQSGCADQITLFRGHLYELARWRRHHDVVLLLNQLHRLRYPLLALDIAAQLTQRCLVLQLPTVPDASIEPVPEDLPVTANAEVLRDHWPKLAFVEKSFGGDAGTWWIPTTAAVEAMVRSTGMEVVARPEPGLFLCQPRKPRVGLSRSSEAEFVAATGTMPTGISSYEGDPINGLTPA